MEKPMRDKAFGVCGITHDPPHRKYLHVDALHGANTYAHHSQQNTWIVPLIHHLVPTLKVLGGDLSGPAPCVCVCAVRACVRACGHPGLGSSWVIPHTSTSPVPNRNRTRPQRPAHSDLKPLVCVCVYVCGASAA